jgi:hypothetical protein
MSEMLRLGHELPPGGLEVAVEVGQIAAAPGAIEHRGAALLEPLRRLVPFDACWIALRDPETRRHVPLVTAGYAEPLRAYFGTPEADAEVELLGLNQSRAPMSVRDLPVPVAEVRAWAEYLWPAGFRGGFAVGLFTPEGRHVGFLSLLTEDAAQPTESVLGLVGALAPVIAHAVDRMQSLTAAARILRDATAGIVLTRAGNSLPLPGLPTHPLLTTRSALLTTAAERTAAGDLHTSFLVPYPGPDAVDGYLRVTVLDCTREPPDHLSAVVTLSPPGDLRGLTGLELRILGLLVEGWPDPRIATALVTDGSLGGHLEHIAVKLAAPSRTVAVLRAFQGGLYVPPPLTDARR